VYVSLLYVVPLSFIVLSGLHQGSVLGPLLFGIFITDFCDIFNPSTCLHFADDLEVYRAVNTPSEWYFCRQILIVYTNGVQQINIAPLTSKQSASIFLLRIWSNFTLSWFFSHYLSATCVSSAIAVRKYTYIFNNLCLSVESLSLSVFLCFLLLFLLLFFVLFSCVILLLLLFVFVLTL
jgi:hypothetical protein